MKSVALLLTAGLAWGQAPYETEIRPSEVQHEISVNRGSAALWQSLKKLHTRASLMMITAHPDDEDGGMLAYESRGLGARVSLLTLNRGEGGANVMSPDFFDALGLVRTMELLQAGRHYGVDQFWTRVVDYGFSKTKAESIGKWTHDRVLFDVVKVVREVRPLVITSVFVGGPSDGHGNHETAGAMAQEVFRAAGDPSVFPEQIQAGLKPWSPVKDYARVPFRRQGANELAVNVRVPEGTYDPLLGYSYVQVAREGLGLQKSQNGGGAMPRAGEVSTGYHRFGSTVDAKETEAGFFDGIDVTLAGIASLAKGGDAAFLRPGLEKMNAAVEEAMAKFSAVKPEATAPSLAAGLKDTVALIAAVEKSGLDAESKYNVLHELRIKQVQFNNALAQALGLAVYGTVAPEKEPDPMYAMFMGDPDTMRVAIPRQTFGVNVRAVNPSAVPVTLERVSLEASGQSWPVAKVSGGPLGPIAGNLPVDTKFSVKVPGDSVYTRAYFSRPDLEQPFYTIDDARWTNRPLAPYPLAAWADFRYQGVPIRIGQVVQTVKRENGFGPVFEPLAVGPAIGVAIEPRAGVVPLEATAFPVKVTVHSNVKGPAKGVVRLELPAGWKSEPAVGAFQTAAEGQDQSLTFLVTPSQLGRKVYPITATAEYEGRRYQEGYQLTGYAGLRPYFLYRPATYKTSGVDVKIAPELRVAYVMGSGDEVPASLEHLGVKVTSLSAADVVSGDLSRFDVVLLGVRAYAARPELSVSNNRLLEYVQQGGVMIVQYNTPEFDHNFGPYPYEMGRNPEEVTDEASRVEILKPEHPLFAWPNRITEKDFEGWVEERGSKWMKSWDAHYEALLETHDADQPPQKGGLLYAKYGKGVYIYNAYAFYRQLPEGVDGAYRIFANMLSLAKNPKIR
ncbi:PIG-L family deacetylase [Paludibaculum fermentans]|uniref:PIG-L family deacetylase n=1 Tax=Paludibaculum fermentans TaxID=1473598 RepID=A0A7S7NX12_PALFE|nr:PIG-L family deacetylase [Paludibaculum fermentans]QOY91324.1 PIG-L family deacetylase [Paludibaculum fermentans]